jgi:hydroxymethylpyrimidine pyrophosphatase-like HAD family hydrolase
MSPQYDMLVIDLDGTLLASDGTVSLRNQQAVRQAREAGIEVIIATGRAMNECPIAIESLDHRGLVVAASGSLLCDAANGNTIERRTLPHDVVCHIAQTLVDDDHKVLVLKDRFTTGFDYLAVGHGELDPASRWWFEHLPVRVRYVDSIADDTHPHDSVRAGAVASADKLAPLARNLREQLGDRCFLQHWSAVTQTQAVGSSTHLLEVFCVNVNKWTMIETCCERSGIDPARVAAIGDGLNDIELVANAGLGIAMENASAEVRAAADRMTGHHDADGVAHAIEQLLCGAW